ncbi:MAG: nickel pincer cofactor biosynthesis protein LarC [Candidatus Hodarchaeales archaeon]|jgi:uncharacterized protein (TIGR00299 family) protein
MTFLVIDPQQSGISGDMLVAALTDLFQAHTKVNQFFKDLISSVSKSHASYITEKETRKNLNGTILKFDIGEDIEKGSVKNFLLVIESILKVIALSHQGKQFVNEVFDTIIQSEAWVHGFDNSDTDKMHFHELHSIDSIVDVITVAYIIDNYYSWDKPIFGLPVSNGTGKLTFSHGEFSLPAPAVAKILQITSYPNFHVEVPFELTTVTGIAVLSKLVTETLLLYPLHKKLSIGIGHGQRNLGKRANFLRLELINILVNKESDKSMVNEEIVVLETHLDDLSGEILGDIIEQFQNDPEVLDISMYNLIMKKNRPGYCIRILCKPKNKHYLSEKLIRFTGTLGVRIYPVQRHIAIRETKTEKLDVLGEEYLIRVKIAKIGDKIINVKPEFDDLKSISEKSGKSVKEIKEIIDSSINRI